MGGSGSQRTRQNQRSGRYFSSDRRCACLRPPGPASALARRPSGLIKTLEPLNAPRGPWGHFAALGMPAACRRITNRTHFSAPPPPRRRGRGSYAVRISDETIASAVAICGGGSGSSRDVVPRASLLFGRQCEPGSTGCIVPMDTGNPHERRWKRLGWRLGMITPLTARCDEGIFR